MVTRNIISVPATFNVPIGQPGNLSITIERDETNQGPVLINVSSDDAAVISVTTPTVTVPAGETTINATVLGEALGSATLRATATNFASDAGVGTVAAALDITATTLTINSAAGGTITIELESPPGVPSPAPSGGDRGEPVSGEPGMCLGACDGDHCGREHERGCDCQSWRNADAALPYNRHGNRPRRVSRQTASRSR